jgi:hypothetical protein
MMGGGVSTESVDYLQRCQQSLSLDDPRGSVTAGDPASRRLIRIRGIGRPGKHLRRLPLQPDERWRPPTTDLITGLYGYRIPLAFQLTGGTDGVQVRLGTWSARGPSKGQDRRLNIIASVLRGLYSSVTLEEVPDARMTWPLSGTALGVPAPGGIDDTDGSGPIDRITRSLAGSQWSALVLAYPVAESAIGGVRAQVLNEMRAVEAAADTEGARSPLAEQYVALLGTMLSSLGEGMAAGSWRTGVYLLGDGESYPRLATVWRSVFSGERSLPEPVRVFDWPGADALAQQWAMPDATGLPGPGHFRRPFEFQSLLTTGQLASYVQLPETETPGFSVDLAPRFDTVPSSSASAPGISIGRVLDRGRETGGMYRTSLTSLTRHVFVAGTTGAGKTNTIFSMLTEADAAGVPFLVIEPAKKEYRALITHPVLGPRIRVFTAGQASVAPLVLNPFEVPPRTAVSEHLDLIRAAFGAAFGMWTPLPQILERCLHEVYTDRGWDLRTNLNSRLMPGADPADAFPTLADLVAKAAEVVPTLGYDDKVASDLRAALTTRLQSLQAGGKGAMLDVARSLPDAELFGHPTVIELEAMGDDGDKAFVTALLLIRLAEYRRATGQADRLVHLLVIEEAHRLLGRGAPKQAEEADPRGQAVETFANLLSEIRAYGQGVIIADQVPVRLAPDVVKNTTLKIAHRLVSADDRLAMGGAMSMQEPQTQALTTLGIGEAAVFGAADDSPLLVRVPLAKNPLQPNPPANEAVASHMARWRQTSGADALFVPRPFCVQTCGGAPAACAAARRLVADDYVQRTVSRIVISTFEEAGALDRLWPDVVDVVRARRARDIDEHQLFRAFAGHAADWYAQRRGAQNAWSYADTAQLQQLLAAVLLDKVDHPSSGSSQLRSDLQETARRLHVRLYLPYHACEFTCRQDPPLCLYKSAVADLVASGRYQPSWREADSADAASAENRRTQTWEVCMDAAYELIEFPEPGADETLNVSIVAAAKRVCMCFEQQMLVDDRRKVPRTSRRILLRVLEEAGL